jgi:hypothetical protein
VCADKQKQKKRRQEAIKIFVAKALDPALPFAYHNIVEDRTTGELACSLASIPLTMLTALFVQKRDGDFQSPYIIYVLAHTLVKNVGALKEPVCVEAYGWPYAAVALAATAVSDSALRCTCPRSSILMQVQGAFERHQSGSKSPYDKRFSREDVGSTTRAWYTNWVLPLRTKVTRREQIRLRMATIPLRSLTRPTMPAGGVPPYTSASDPPEADQDGDFGPGLIDAGKGDDPTVADVHGHRENSYRCERTPPRPGFHLTTSTFCRRRG